MNIASIPREYRELPIHLIDDPLLPSRSSMDETKLDELVASIRANGVVQPLAVVRTGERYEVIAGHRRRVASCRAGLVVLPCLVYPSKDAALEAVQFAENRHREDLNAADEAIWFSELLDGKCAGDIEVLAALVGEKVAYIDNRLALFHGGKEVFEALQAGQIKVTVAHELNKIPDAEYRRYYLDAAIRGGATSSVVVGWVTEWKQMFGAAPPRPPAPTMDVIVAPGSIVDPFACLICGKSDHAHAIRFVPLHTHCHLAILEPLLAQARAGSA